MYSNEPGFDARAEAAGRHRDRSRSAREEGIDPDAAAPHPLPARRDGSRHRHPAWQPPRRARRIVRLDPMTGFPRVESVQSNE